jgi:hypothetical protein
MVDSVPKHTGPISLTDTPLEPSIFRTQTDHHRREVPRDDNHDLKNLFKGAAISASTRPGPLCDFYVALVEKGMRPTMARLTLARKMAAITLTIWKKGVEFDAKQLNRQAA